MKVNWFSPLPPARTGIADYTALVLPVLAKQCHVVLWTNQESWNIEIEKYAEVKSFKPERIDWREVNRADVTILHIGNNQPYHGAIFEVSRQVPATMVLHDVSLHIFVEHMFRLQWNDLDEYYRQMYYYYGEKGLRDAATFTTVPHGVDFEYMSYQYPLTEFVIGRSLGTVVHTRTAFDALNKTGKIPCIYAPLPYPMMPSRVATEDQKWRVSSPQRFNLILFGFIGYNRRLDAVLDALAGFPERESFHLDIVGELHDEKAIRHKLERLDLNTCVSLHGYVSEAELNRFLSNAHIAFNLRYPTMGEASLSQLQIWSYALPSLVTPIGWYADIPEEIACFVRVDHEVEDVLHHLAAFLKNPASFRAMGERGRDLLREQHNMETYVDSLLEFSQMVQTDPAAIAPPLIEKVGKELSEWTDARLGYQDIRRIAAAVKELAG
ncbi:MAG: glycosyltransferase [Ignavibacteria bacterium]|nr:glycosyltransferase [Ignavibacteria bacterium]MBI3765204.1 glycosyltransferase [Ignavibacteriales bacterium]